MAPPGWAGAQPHRERARLAWCYNDLGVAIALLSAAFATGTPRWRAEALALARACARRSIVAVTALRDTGGRHPAGAGTTVPHPGLGPQSLTVRAGTVIDFVNADSLTHVIHGSGGIPHESVIGGGPGTTYTVTVNSSGTWYCHSHENTSLARTVTVVP